MSRRRTGRVVGNSHHRRARKKVKTVPGLSFRVTVEPLVNGVPHDDPVSFEWNQSYATRWYETAQVQDQDRSIQTVCLDLQRRVAGSYGLDLKR